MLLEEVLIVTCSEKLLDILFALDVVLLVGDAEFLLSEVAG